MWLSYRLSGVNYLTEYMVYYFWKQYAYWGHGAGDSGHEKKAVIFRKVSGRVWEEQLPFAVHLGLVVFHCTVSETEQVETSSFPRAHYAQHLGRFIWMPGRYLELMLSRTIIECVFNIFSFLFSKPGACKMPHNLLPYFCCVRVHSCGWILDAFMQKT